MGRSDGFVGLTTEAAATDSGAMPPDAGHYPQIEKTAKTVSCFERSLQAVILQCTAYQRNGLSPRLERVGEPPQRHSKPSLRSETGADLIIATSTNGHWVTSSASTSWLTNTTRQTCTTSVDPTAILARDQEDQTAYTGMPIANPMDAVRCEEYSMTT